MAGYKDGQQWQEGDIRYTVNTANDRQLVDLGLSKGAYYLTQLNTRTGEKATAVYLADGRLAPVKANRDWKPVKTQRAWGPELRRAFIRGIRWGTGGRR